VRYSLHVAPQICGAACNTAHWVRYSRDRCDHFIRWNGGRDKALLATETPTKKHQAMTAQQYLLNQAEHCRRSAEDNADPFLAEELRRLADEFERKARIPLVVWRRRPPEAA
jgi:hypothetical protein